MSEKPVAWIVETADGPIATTNKDGALRMNATPLYSQSPAEARALAIAEAAQVCSEIAALSKENESEWTAKGALICETTIRALSPAPSVSEEWIRAVINLDHTLATMRDCEQRDIAVRATLAALGVTVEGAAK